MRILLLWLYALGLWAQMAPPVQWQWEILPKKKLYQVGEIITLRFTAQIPAGYHLYAAQPPNRGGYKEAAFLLDDSSKGVQLVGKLKDLQKPESHWDDIMEDTVRYFKHQTQFAQQIKITSTQAYIAGYLEYQYCSEDMGLCFYPKYEVRYKIPVKQRITLPIKTKKQATLRTEKKDTVQKDTTQLLQKNITPPAKRETPSTKETAKAKPQKGLGWIFWEAFLFGLLGIFTPCVFPMIPLTVSYFTKQSSSRIKGIAYAFLYGGSILFIYVVLGLIVTIFFGATAMYAMASNPWLNLFFFVLLFLFGLSFLGWFELQLPSSWATALDRYATLGSIVGTFFMALTLVLVSFSCTGPLVGTILIDAASGERLAPLVGMLGFGLAFALPFGLLALFPRALERLPRSGAWLNTVKVSLGFLELALSLKFLSNADLVWHLGILDREIYLSAWIVLFTMLGLYYLGFIRMKGEPPLEGISVPRLLLAMFSFWFVLYMLPGLWGAPLKFLSGFLPPVNPDIGVRVLSSTTTTSAQHPVCQLPRKYADLFAKDTPEGFCVFYDLDEARAYARQVQKPLFIDFTGHTCVNCRQVESNVWSHPEIKKLLQESFVMVSLFVDDRYPLEKPRFTADGKKLKTIGDWWLHIQDSLFHTNAQPYYVITDFDLHPLTEPMAFELSIERYKAFLEEGLRNFQQYAKY